MGGRGRKQAGAELLVEAAVNVQGARAMGEQGYTEMSLQGTTLSSNWDESCPITLCSQRLKADMCPFNPTTNSPCRQHVDGLIQPTGVKGKVPYPHEKAQGQD